MAFINVIPPQEASGRLEKVYRQVKSPAGQVDNVLQIHSLRPHTLSGHMAIYKAVLHHSGNLLPEWYLEAVGVLVSQLNGCAYCAYCAYANRTVSGLGVDMEGEVIGQSPPTGGDDSDWSHG